MKSLIVVLSLLLSSVLSTVPLVADEGAQRSFDITYKAVIKEIPRGAKEVVVWIPVPQSDEHQKIDNLRVDAPFAGRMGTEAEYGNFVYCIPVRDISVESFEIVVRFTVTRKENRHDPAKLAHFRETESTTEISRRYLSADKLGTVDDKVREIATSTTAGKTGVVAKARAIYDYVLDHMEYDKVTPGWGRGDTVRACAVGKGNCSDYHSLFVSLCRASGIAARFEYGMMIPGDKAGTTIPHCWAEFHVPGYGWAPVDISEADKQPTKREYYFGSHDQNRVQFSIGRDVMLTPAQKGEPLNFLIHPYVETDGKEHGAVTTEYRYGDAAAKATDNARPAETGSGKPSLKFYGFLRLDAIYDDSRPSDRQTPMWINSEDPAVGRNDDDDFSMHPRLTRLGLDVDGTSLDTLGNAAVSGKLEVDFQNGPSSESRQMMRIRHAWLKLGWGKTTLLAGQTWDVIAPIFPTVNNDTLMWNTGNLGDRRPQIRLGHTLLFLDGDLLLEGALGQTGAVSNDDRDVPAGIRDGEDAGVPMMQGRVGYSHAFLVEKKPLVLGFWGHRSWEETDTRYGGKDKFDGSSVGLDLTLPLHAVLTVKGELWRGKCLTDLRGGVGQSINTTTGDEVESKGGWAEVVLALCKGYAIAAGYTVDDPKNGDLPVGGREKNDAWYIGNRFDLGGGVSAGLDYLRWTTDYVDRGDGDDNRFNLFVQYAF